MVNSWSRGFAGFGAVTFVAALLLASACARGVGVDYAKRDLDRAQEIYDQQRYGDVEDQLRQVETDLKDVPDADKAALLAQVAALRKQAAAHVLAEQAGRIERDISSDLDSVEADIHRGELDRSRRIEGATTRLNGPDARRYLAPEVMARLKARLKQVEQEQADLETTKKLQYAATPLKELQDRMDADPFKGLDADRSRQVATALDQSLSSIRSSVGGLPKDNPAVKAFNLKVDALATRISTGEDASGRTQAEAALADGWKTARQEFAGWEQETAVPTWEQYTKQASQAMADLKMPKTALAAQRSAYWLDQDGPKSAQAKYKDDPAIAATLADATRTHTTALAKLNGAFDQVMREAEQKPAPRNKFERQRLLGMANLVDRWFKGTAYEEASAARVKALGDKWDAAVAAVGQAADALYKKMSLDAAAAWPAIESAARADTGFDPTNPAAFKGKTIKLKGVYNRSGWDYDGKYDFAVRLRGTPVAGMFSPAVRAAFQDARHKTRQDIDDHKPWDLIAVVEGPGQIGQRTTTDVQDSSGTRIAKLEDYRPTPCAVIRVIALHAGPVAVGPAAGDAGAAESSADASASVPPSAASASRVSAGASLASVAITGVVWLVRVVWLLIALAAAGLVVYSARPRPVPAPVALGAGVSAPVSPTSDSLGYVGLLIALLGLFQLLGGLIIGDLLPAATLIAAGLYIAADFLLAKGAFKPAAYARIKPMGFLIAGATAFFALLHLFLGHWWLL